MSHLDPNNHIPEIEKRKVLKENKTKETLFTSLLFSHILAQSTHAKGLLNHPSPSSSSPSSPLPP
jgi:hypothetical protein